MRIDCHNDSVQFLRESGSSLANLPAAHLDLNRFRQYLDVAFFALFVDEKKEAGRETAEARLLCERLLADLASVPGVTQLLWREQLTENNGESMVLLAMEGAAPLGQQGEDLPEFYAQGLRALSLTWNHNNAYAGSNLYGGGLTRAGRDLVQKCNALGVLLDAAHSSEATLRDLLKWSTQPIVDSHTVCGGLCNRWPRATSDESLRQLAAKGGVAAITFVPNFLGNAGDWDGVCAHIEYAVSLIGSEHVALGADYDGAGLHEETAGVQYLPALYQRLRERGMAEEDLANVQGESVRRLLQRVLPAKA